MNEELVLVNLGGLGAEAPLRGYSHSVSRPHVYLRQPQTIASLHFVMADTVGDSPPGAGSSP
jgi:hypothetical protein